MSTTESTTVITSLYLDNLTSVIHSTASTKVRTAAQLSTGHIAGNGNIITSSLNHISAITIFNLYITGLLSSLTENIL